MDKESYRDDAHKKVISLLKDEIFNTEIVNDIVISDLIFRLKLSVKYLELLEFLDKR